jgi:hypothetical protein
MEDFFLVAKSSWHSSASNWAGIICHTIGGDEGTDDSEVESLEEDEGTDEDKGSEGDEGPEGDSGGNR